MWDADDFCQNFVESYLSRSLPAVDERTKSYVTPLADLQMEVLLLCADYVIQQSTQRQIDTRSINQYCTL